MTEVSQSWDRLRPWHQTWTAWSNRYNDILYKEVDDYMEAELISVSISLFGTPDYESAISILPAYDGAVKEFLKKADSIRKKYNNRKDDSTNG